MESWHNRYGTKYENRGVSGCVKRIPKRRLFLSALEERGYRIDRFARSTHYLVMECGGGRPLVTGPHRILLGKAGALRLTRGKLENSVDISGTWSAMLISEAELLS